MKKVYTVTFHNANNYGALLQTYALYTILHKNYDVQVIDYNLKCISQSSSLFYRKSKSLKNTVKALLKFPYQFRRIHQFNKLRKRIRFTNKFYEINQLKAEYPQGDAYICGSDQVWNPKLTNGFDDGYFLKFGDKNTKKIAYAASCGSIKYLLEDIRDFKKEIADFDAISVREKELQDFIVGDSSTWAELVLDPTLLLEKNDWLSLTKKCKKTKEKYIFAYSVGNATENFYNIVNELAKKTDCVIYYFELFDKENNYKYRKKSCYTKGPIEFVNLINNAEFIVTTSFHGLALSSVLNRKAFIVLSTYPERLITLMDKLSLPSQLIINEIFDIDELANLSVPWQSVNQKLENEREKSLKWLNDSINN